MFGVAALLTGAACSVGLFYFFANPPLWLDGPELFTLGYFLELDQLSKVVLVGLSYYLLLSIGCLTSAVALFKGRRGGRAGVATTVLGAAVAGIFIWVLEGRHGDLPGVLTLVGVAVATVWVLFFYGPAKRVFGATERR